MQPTYKDSFKIPEPTAKSKARRSPTKDNPEFESPPGAKGVVSPHVIYHPSFIRTNAGAHQKQPGHKLVVYDVFPEAMVPFKEAGATICTSPGDVVMRSSCVITMLPSNAHVLQVYQGEGGILESVKRGTLLIDSSTVDPSIAKAVAAGADRQGALFFDAPVSGGIMAAASAKLTFIVGGNSAEFAAVQELLQVMGSRAVLCGPVGSGQAAKICNNMLLGVSMIGTAEAMNLGIRLGLDPKKLMEVINSCSGRCWSSDVYNPGGFASRLMAKDLSLAQDAANHSQSPIPLGALAHQLYRIMVLSGWADKDFSSVYEYIKEEDK
uniref:3-hydroxyisobutyrate dehydrogenase n=1 Tax=Timema cristinae TaxID=61476 RepID=A0A7R9CAW7_TIMCR|nr:unnamed protein product [Timema cristinae]